MSFSHLHYVPVLRWKRAESGALGDLSDHDRDLITPFVELPPRSFRGWGSSQTQVANEAVERALNRLQASWGGRLAFLDVELLSPAIHGRKDENIWSILARVAHTLGLRIAPVVGLASDPKRRSGVTAAYKSLSNGVCIRVKVAETTRRDFTERLTTLLEELGAELEQVHLVVDYGYVAGAIKGYEHLCEAIPELGRYRTFSVVGGTFPKNLSGFRVGQHEISRQDWKSWCQQVANGRHLIRMPTYGDYTIQHPIFEEPPGRANFSASIRYAAAEHWVIMRGEGVFNVDGPGFGQWPANAQLLCDRPEFCGSTFSSGDSYIHGMGQQTDRTGNAETWLRAGINHHLVLVARQLASLIDAGNGA
jgi:hypothetical protein